MSAQDFRQIYKYKSDYAFAVGISTLQLVGDNPAGEYIKYLPEIKSFGGGFVNAESGIDLRVTRYLDDEDVHRIPLGFSIYFFDSQTKSFLSSLLFTDTHSFNISNVYTGWHYSMARFPLGNAHLWAGIELHASYLSGRTYSRKLTVRGDGTQKDIDGFVKAWEESYVGNNTFELTKENTLRLGTLFRLGIDGEIQERWMINMSGGLQLLNLFLRDDSTGNLLLTRKNAIINETYAWAFNFSLLIQYRL